jgi:glutathione peroxidase
MKLYILLLPAALLLTNCSKTNRMTTTPPSDTAKPASSFYDLQATSLDGKTVRLDAFRGKKIVILNVASECGYTPQYADWEKWYEANKDRAVVLGFPSNQFGEQEPGTAQDIAAFCQKNYGVTFPMFEKVEVKGPGKAPVYQWLTDPARNGWNSEEPAWNFNKYVIDENGKLTHFFKSKIKPDSPEFQQAVGR